MTAMAQELVMRETRQTGRSTARWDTPRWSSSLRLNMSTRLLTTSLSSSSRLTPPPRLMEVCPAILLWTEWKETRDPSRAGQSWGILEEEAHYWPTGEDENSDGCFRGTHDLQYLNLLV